MEWTRRAAAPGRRPRGVPRDDADRLPGGGSRAARLVRGRLHRDPGGHRAAAGRGRARRHRRGHRIPGPASRDWRPGSGCPPARRWTPRRCCTAARSWSPRPSITCRTTGCSTSTGTSCPATGCRWSGCRSADGAAGRRGRGHRHLRGPVAGRRPGRGDPAGRARACWWCPNASPYERGKERGPAGAVRAPGPRGGRRAGLREHDGRPGRAGLRRRLDHRGRQRPPDRPRAAVRGGAAGRRPGPAPRPLDLQPGETPAEARDGTRDDHSPGRAAALARPGGTSHAGRTGPAPAGTRRARLGPAPSRPSGRGCPRGPRSTPRWSPGCGTTCTRTGSARSFWACPGGSTPRWSRRSPPTRSARSAVHVVLMPSRYSSEHSVGDAEELAKRQGLHARTVPIAAHGRRVPGRTRPARAGRGEPAVPDPRA